VPVEASRRTIAARSEREEVMGFEELKGKGIALIESAEEKAKKLAATAEEKAKVAKAAVEEKLKELKATLEPPAGKK
jgi:cell division septum initiation protein DivIVA